MRVVCRPHKDLFDSIPKLKDTIRVLLYGRPTDGFGMIGRDIIEQLQLHNLAPDPVAWDFMSLALAIYAADISLLRADAEDSWTRKIDLNVALYQPELWHPLMPQFEKAFRFLSGDIWSITISPNGTPPPQTESVKQEKPVDCVCLFSGGMDSFIGAYELFDKGRNPYLVSQAFRTDRRFQSNLVEKLSNSTPFHFQANIEPRNFKNRETSMRTRSIVFLAMAALVSSSMNSGGSFKVGSSTEPENATPVGG